MKKGYIYKITNLINNKIYIGKTITTPNKRFKRHISSSFNKNNTGYNCYLHSSIRKYGKENFVVEEICYCDENELSRAECYFIKIHKEKGFSLMNLTDGGEGMCGYKPSKETIEKIKKKNSIKVYQYDLEGNFIKCFNSIKTASIENNLFDSSIIKVCKGQILSSGGYLWSYEYKDMTLESQNNKTKSYKSKGANRTTSRPVLMIDINGNIVKRYEYLREVLKDGYDNGTISKVCNRRLKTAYGFNWKFD